MGWFEAILLGILQGVAEFLPISSSGHLVLTERAFGLTPNLTLNVFLHMGTLGAIVAYYRRDVRELTLHALDLIRFRLKGEPREFILKLLVATTLTAAIGFLLEGPIETIFAGARWRLWLGVTFFITALSLSTLFFLNREAGRRVPSWPGALIIGVVQGLAVFPGISRSGSTIVIAMIFGMTGVAAARFSFLLAIPVIAGAGLLHARHLVGIESPGPVAAGVAAAFVVGFLSLWFLVKLINKGKMAWFALYLFPLAAYVWFGR